MTTRIEWCDEVWNPITGCTAVSAGCDHCYARRMATRLRGRCGYDADNPFRVTFHLDRLRLPEKWRKPRRVLVNSMGDLFHKDVPFGYVELVWVVMTQCPRHTFMILTKRPERMKEFVGRGSSPATPNIWLGVSAEDQVAADERIPWLLQTPAAKRFVSIEPMLGPVDLTGIKCKVADGFFGDCMQWYHRGKCHRDAGIVYPTVDWVILGGETGPGARPMKPEWVRSVREQCAVAGVPFFLKKMSDGTGELDGREWREVPE